MLKLNKIRQLLALFIFLAIVSLAAVIALKTYRGMRGGRILSSLPKNIDISLQKIHYTETKGGAKKWDLLADKAEYDKGGDLVRLSGIHLEVALAGKPGEVVLTSERAVYHAKTRDVELMGNVLARSASGMKFTTEKVAYVAAESTLQSGERVKFTDGNLKVEGTGMEFKVETKKLKILQQVTASYNPRKVKQ